MGIGLADEADDAARRNDGHVLGYAFIRAGVDDHRVAPRAVIAGNDDCGSQLVLAVGRAEVEELAQAVVFGHQFVVVDGAALELGVFPFQRFPFNAVF